MSIRRFAVVSAVLVAFTFVAAPPLAAQITDSIGVLSESDELLSDPAPSTIGAPSGGVAVVGIDWPGTPAILWEAAKETAYSDGDPVTTPTQFGSLSTVLPTQSTTAAKMTFQDPCDAGPSIPCWRLDGGDNAIWGSPDLPIVRFLHDGTGATCAVVAEYDVAASGAYSYFNTYNSTGSEVGYAAEHNGTGNWVTTQAANGTAAIFSTNVSITEGQTYLFMSSHGTARSPQRSVGSKSSYTSGAYLATPNTGNSVGLAIGSRVNATAKALGYLFAIACWDLEKSTAELDDIAIAVEAVTGALPQ